MSSPLSLTARHDSSANLQLPGPVGLAQENMTETNPELKTSEGGACLPMPNLARVRGRGGRRTAAGSFRRPRTAARPVFPVRKI